MGEANLTSAVAPPSAAPPPSLPSIPGYRPVALLGSGGMASVWMAERRFDDDGETATERRWCALKVTHPYVVDEDVVQGRFRREAQVASMLRHPNIAGVWRSGVFGRQLYLEMELIGGVSLASLLSRMRERDAPVPQGLLWQLNDEVLSALAYAHELRGADGQSLGVVHRDLSPSNVLIGFDGRARIIDFGMVRACLGGFQTMLGQIGGTPRYMSPEQARGRQVDRRSDLYSWAVVMAESLTGRPIVKTGNLPMTLRSVLNDPAPSLSTLDASMPVGLDPIFASLLAKRPAERPDTAEQVRQAIGAVVHATRWTELDVGMLVRRLFAARYDVFLRLKNDPPTSAAAATDDTADVCPPMATTVVRTLPDTEVTLLQADAPPSSN